MFHVRSKKTFSPAFCNFGGFGETLNENLVDGAIPVMASADKLAVTALAATDPLNQSTPFDHVPEVVEGSET